MRDKQKITKCYVLLKENNVWDDNYHKLLRNIKSFFSGNSENKKQVVESVLGCRDYLKSHYFDNFKNVVKDYIKKSGYPVSPPKTGTTTSTSTSPNSSTSTELVLYNPSHSSSSPSPNQSFLKCYNHLKKKGLWRFDKTKMKQLIDNWIASHEDYKSGTKRQQNLYNKNSTCSMSSDSGDFDDFLVSIRERNKKRGLNKAKRTRNSNTKKKCAKRKTPKKRCKRKSK
jgi:hypothetical protein